MSRLWIALLCLFILSSVIPVQQSAKAAAPGWSEISGLPTANLLQGVRYGGTEWLALGLSATLLESTDGTSWSAQVPAGAADEWTDAVHDGSNWVLVGSGGKIYVSKGNLASGGWNKQTSGTTTDLFGIAFGNSDTYVAVGDQGLILTSRDGGTTWTPRSFPGDASEALYSVVYAEGLFAAASSAGSIYTSPDGVTWAKRQTGSSSLHAIHYGNGKFVAVGSGAIYFSDDGLTWTDTHVSGAGELYAVAYGNGKYVAAGANGRLWTSADAENWSETESSGTSDDLYGIGFSPDQRRFVAAGGSSTPVMVTQVQTESDKLSSLVLSAGTLTPAFSPDVTGYTTSVPDTTDKITVTPTTVESGATIKYRVNGGAFTSAPSGVASAPIPTQVGSTTIELQVTSSGGSMRTYTIVVNRSEPNVAPTDLTLSNNQILENQAANTVIGTLLATDGNTTETFTYALVAGDTSSFAISGNQLLSTEVFDYEGSKKEYNITIRVTDSRGGSFAKVFAIKVQNENELPVVTDNSQTGQEDQPVIFAGSDFQSFYSDPEQEALQKVQITGLPSSGTLSLNGVAVTLNQEIAVADLTGLRFTPTADWFGNTSFTWKGYDGNAYSTQAATFTLTISAENDLPAVSGFTKNALENQPISFAASDFVNAFHDADPGDTLTQVKIVSLPGEGSLLLNDLPVTADQEILASDLSQLSYTPASGKYGTFTFAWLGHDGTGYSAASAVATMEIASVNDLPIVSNNSKSGTEDQSIAFGEADFTGAFADGDGDSLTKILLETLPDNGTLKRGSTALNAGEEITVDQLADMVFVPDANWSGTTNFTWKGSDGIAYSTDAAVFTLQVAPVNDPPAVSDTGKNGAEDNVLSFAESDFVSAYTDVDGESLQRVRIESLPSHGTLKLDETDVQEQQEIPASELSRLGFIPDANWNGQTSFSWSGQDGQAYAEAAAFAITLVPVNDAPAASDGALRLTQNQTKEGKADASDIDGDALTYQVVSQGSKGTVDMDPATGQFTYKPQRNATGSDSFTFVANDGTLDSNTATIQITISAIIVPPAPVFGPTISSIANQTVNQGDSTDELTFTVNDADDDPRSLTVTAYSDNPRLVPNENIRLAGSGTNRTIQVTPLAGQHGAATINVSVSDGKTNASTSFTVIVNERNHSPKALDGFLVAEKPEPAKGVLQATDEDGDSLTFELVRQASKGKVTLTNARTGAYTYTPNKGSSSSSEDSFTFKVNDGQADSNVATVKISRKASSDATLQALSVSEGKLTPTFSSRRTSYTVKVSKDVTGIKVTPTTAHEAATVTVDKEAVERGASSSLIALKPGNNVLEVTVTAQDGKTRKTYKLTVERDYTPITELKLEKHSLTLTEGDDPVVLAVRIKPDQEMGNQLVWKSSRTSVATVDETGTVVARKKGTATITVSSLDGKVKDKLTVKVEEGKVLRLEADSTMLVMNPDDSETVKILAYYKQGTVQDVTDQVRWSTKNRRVASVSQGKIVANGTGSTLITASFADTSVSMRVSVYEKAWVDERKVDVSLEEADSPDGVELRIEGELSTEENLLVQVKIGKKTYDADVDREEGTFSFTRLFDEQDELPENVQLIAKPSSSKKQEQIITLPIRLFDEASVQVKELRKQPDKKKKSYSMTGKLYDDTAVMKVELVQDDEVVATGEINRGKFEIPSFPYDGGELILRATSYTGFVQEWEVAFEE